MFTWNVEEQKLRKNQYTIGRIKIYNCENSTSREDKIAFVDSMQDGKLSYILELSEKFEQDRKNIPKDKWGYVKTVSLKAWIKKNDTKYGQPIIDTEYKYGSFYICSVERNICSIAQKSCYDYYDDIVDEVFHRQLTKCEEKRRRIFSFSRPIQRYKIYFKELHGKILYNFWRRYFLRQ